MLYGELISQDIDGLAVYLSGVVTLELQVGKVKRSESRSLERWRRDSTQL